MLGSLLTPIVAILNILVLLSAFILVHVQAGVFVDNEGFELVLVLLQAYC